MKLCHTAFKITLLLPNLLLLHLSTQYICALCNYTTFSPANTPRNLKYEERFTYYILCCFTERKYEIIMLKIAKRFLLPVLPLQTHQWYWDHYLEQWRAEKSQIAYDANVYKILMIEQLPD